MPTNTRLEQMITLLEKMSAGSKMPSDGLGIYLGDGLPRPGLGNLRSIELLNCLKELLDLQTNGEPVLNEPDEFDK